MAGFSFFGIALSARPPTNTFIRPLYTAFISSLTPRLTKTFSGRQGDNLQRAISVKKNSLKSVEISIFIPLKEFQFHSFAFSSTGKFHFLFVSAWCSCRAARRE
jgi:hypothetical protein